MFFFVLLWEVRLEREINVNEFFFFLSHHRLDVINVKVLTLIFSRRNKMAQTVVVRLNQAEMAKTIHFKV